MKITEELDETTYLDRIYLRIDENQIIELDSIKNQNEISDFLSEYTLKSLLNSQLLKYSDNNYLILKKRDVYYLQFSIPENFEKIEFVAEGYYKKISKIFL